MKERKNKKNMSVIRFVLIFILVGLIVASYKCIRLYNVKKEEYNDKKQQIENLNNEIKEEESKIKQIDKNISHVITDEEYESLAREELGLIKKDEIIIKPR